MLDLSLLALQELLLSLLPCVLRLASNFSVLHSLLLQARHCALPALQEPPVQLVATFSSLLLLCKMRLQCGPLSALVDQGNQCA